MGKASTHDICRLMINHVLKCPSLSQLNFWALCFFPVYLLPFFAPCLHPLETGIVSGRRFHQINNPQADKVYEDYYIQECWPSKETWLTVLDIFLVGGRNLFSPSVACSNPLQVLETYGLCRIYHCTFTHQVFVVIHTVKRGSMIYAGKHI